MIADSVDLPLCVCVAQIQYFDIICITHTDPSAPYSSPNVFAARKYSFRYLFNPYAPFLVLFSLKILGSDNQIISSSSPCWVIPDEANVKGLKGLALKGGKMYILCWYKKNYNQTKDHTQWNKFVWVCVSVFSSWLGQSLANKTQTHFAIRDEARSGWQYEKVYCSRNFLLPFYKQSTQTVEK